MTNSKTFRFRIIVAALLLPLSACSVLEKKAPVAEPPSAPPAPAPIAPQPEPPAPAPKGESVTLTAAMPRDFPVDRYRQAAAAGKQVFRIQPRASQLRILVYRGGRLAKLGHNHVIASQGEGGYILLATDLTRSRFDLYLPVSTLRVDDPDHRQQAGEDFASTPSAADIESTRQNMLSEQVLDAGRFNFVLMSGRLTGGRLPRPELEVDLTLRGIAHALKLRPRVEVRNGRLVVSGEFGLKQSDFGITPFSVLMGALLVKDEVRVQFHLVAAAVD